MLLIINGSLKVATEVFNDSGLPHTLEHLIFLGSEKCANILERAFDSSSGIAHDFLPRYPYNGLLHTLANRAFASGANAMTKVTHTSYTCNTVGSDGFLRLVPGK